LVCTFALGTLEGFAYGYWSAESLQGRWLLALFEEWWFNAGARLLPASVVALLAFRLAAPSLGRRLPSSQSWWGAYFALVACFAGAVVLAMIWGFVWSMPLAFLVGVGCSAAVLRLERLPVRVAA
jgi:hypothetical protein